MLRPRSEFFANYCDQSYWMSTAALGYILDHKSRVTISVTDIFEPQLRIAIVGRRGGKKKNLTVSGQQEAAPEIYRESTSDRVVLKWF